MTAVVLKTTERKPCAFDSRRFLHIDPQRVGARRLGRISPPGAGYSSARARSSTIEVWCSLANIPHLECGDRWFKSSRLDQFRSVV